MQVQEFLFHTQNTSFSFGLGMVRGFKWVNDSKIDTTETLLSTREREDQSLCTLEPLCSNTFDTVEQFENYVAENNQF